MKKVTLSKIRHRDEDQIAVSFQFDDEIRKHLRQLEQVKWSKAQDIA